MSKLSPSLKALVNAPFARPGPRPAPSHMRAVFQSIAHDAAQKKLGQQPWLAISTAATFTLNSTEALGGLHAVAGGDVAAAELMREVGLKCISFNGIPRSINGLNAFYAALPAEVRAQLATAPSRRLAPANLEARLADGRALWTSVYAPFENKLEAKLAQAHPDLPVHILQGHYAGVLSNPPAAARTPGLASVGRVLTSLVAIACLRAQTGVGPQVLSHVFGLRKAVEDGSFKGEGETVGEDETRWLASDEGGEWILGTVDRIVEAFGGESFAPGRAKL